MSLKIRLIRKRIARADCDQGFAELPLRLFAIGRLPSISCLFGVPFCSGIDNIRIKRLLACRSIEKAVLSV